MKFFVGCYTRLGGPGVALCELEGNSLRLLESTPLLENPTYLILSRDRKTLYATSSSSVGNEEGGSVAAFDVSDGHLRLISQQSAAGRSVCHITLSPDEKFLYAANYFTGNLSVFPVSGAQISPRIQRIQHEGSGPYPERQECAHCHFVAFDPADDRLLYAVDLGIDAVVAYRQDPETGLLTEHQRIGMPAGYGPRHLIFDGRDTMYVAHELGNAVSVLRRTAAGWEILQTISTLPDGWTEESAVAAIRILGRTLIVSNRFHDSLAFFEIGPDALLTPLHISSTLGKTPRDFIPLPDDRLLVANQDSGDIRLFEFDRGSMTQTGEALPFPGALCVCPLTE